jgi:TRAP-type mannitol/chloroaromatic compound transport system permease small subunit
LLFFAVLLYAGAIRFWEAWSIRETAHTLWAPPIYPLILTIPASALLLMLQSVADFIRNLHHAVNGRELK